MYILASVDKVISVMVVQYINEKMTDMLLDIAK